MPRKTRSSSHKAKKEIHDSGEKNAVGHLQGDLGPILETNAGLKKTELLLDVCKTNIPVLEKDGFASTNACLESNGEVSVCDSCQGGADLKLTNSESVLQDSLWTAVELDCHFARQQDEKKSESLDGILSEPEKCISIIQDLDGESRSRFAQEDHQNGEVPKDDFSCSDGGLCSLDAVHCNGNGQHSVASNIVHYEVISNGTSEPINDIEDRFENDRLSENLTNSCVTPAISETSSISHASLVSQVSLVEPTVVDMGMQNFDLVTPELCQSEKDALVEKSEQQKIEIMRLKEENGRLQQQLNNNSYEVIPLSEATADIYEVQMAALEKTITQLQREVDVYRDKLSEQDELSKNSIANLKRDFSAKLEKLLKKLDVSEKEKETMVVKYAQSEKTSLTLKKGQEDLERKLRESAREKEMLLGKVRSLTNERARLTQALDNKSVEINSLQRECERLKEEILSKDIKIKWGQNKLKTEMDAHKETLIKLEKVQHKLKETREESDQVRRDCQAMIHTYQESEEIKSNSLDLQLREKETELELERQEKSDQEEVYQMMKNELEALKKKHKYSLDESNTLTMKVQCLERERLDYEQNLSKLREQLNIGQQEIVDLHAKLAEMENLKAQINREREKVAVNQSEIERLRQANVDLQIDMEACRRKEGELLEFTERLTSKNVTLQSEYSCLEAKFQAQEREFTRLIKLVDEMDQKNSVVMVQLQDEQQLRKQETQLLARKLAEKTKAVDNLNLKLEEQNNDNAILRRKNASSIRELTREIQVLRRRLDNYELSRSGANESHTLCSRSSSTGSLDTVSAGPNGSSSGNHLVGKMAPLHNGLQQDVRTVISAEPPLEPSRQMLIERIVKLQRAHARKNEKIEFLEEHVNQLFSELKKKSKVIQNYIMREEAGALSTISMDQNKAELARKGGIMASLYTSHQVDDGMTIELALEISRKLQTVLEDTLLKNITLKENIKTLGDEIERLSRERKQPKN